MDGGKKDRQVVFLDREKAFDQLLKMGGLLAFEDEVNEVLAKADWNEVEEISRTMDDRWLHNLMKKEKRKERWGRISRGISQTASATACILGILLSLSLLLFLTVEPVRAQLIRFIASRYPEYSHYAPILEEEAQSIELLYEPTYLPEGFELSFDKTYGNYERLMGWSNGERLISFRQAAVGDNAMLDTEAADIQIISLHGEIAELVQNSTSVEIYFVKENVSFTLTVDGELEEAIEIAESIILETK